MNNDGRSTARPEIVIAGASGFIGTALIPALLERFPTCHITALSRSQQASADPRVEWKACDLFSIASIESSLPKQIDLALYLVHSMGPTAHLDQGTFADYDLILADNFARAIAGTGVKHLIYLGGLIPAVEHLSRHLLSRVEVEDTFRQHNLPLTVFRAGMILGDKGSSYQILLKLVKRLPIMVCPAWTQTLTTPVDLASVLHAISSSALDPNHFNKTYDLAGCRPLTYLSMMRETARRIGKRPLLMTVPFFTPTLSRLWVSLITNTSKSLVYPLVESLEHPMVARQTHLYSHDWMDRSYSELLEHASIQTRPGTPFFKFKAPLKTVRSVQRLPLPPGRDAAWVRDQYSAWLPRFLRPAVGVRSLDLTLVFFVVRVGWPLLQLRLDPRRSDPDRQILTIERGLMVAEPNRGRLEFRVVLNRRFVLAAIHDYRPSLPWYLYVVTQAPLHLWVMQSFGRYLSASCGRDATSAQ